MEEKEQLIKVVKNQSCNKILHKYNFKHLQKFFLYIFFYLQDST